MKTFKNITEIFEIYTGFTREPMQFIQDTRNMIPVFQAVNKPSTRILELPNAIVYVVVYNLLMN